MSIKVSSFDLIGPEWNCLRIRIGTGGQKIACSSDDWGYEKSLLSAETYPPILPMPQTIAREK